MDIKLTPKQLAALQTIQAQKAELNKQFQVLNKDEALILELVFDTQGIEGATVASVKLEGDKLVYELAATKPKAKQRKLKASELLKETAVNGK